MKTKIFLPLIALMLFLCSCSKKNSENVIQIGHFPNVTHAQALVAHQMSIEGRGWFEKYFGDDVKIEWRIFNAGPSAVESLFTQSVDITYVGPNPAINAHIKSGGKDIKLIAGSADGGAALLVHKNSELKKPEDFRGKRIATPQLGNTQDVACRAWLIKNGMNIKFSGGDAYVIPTSNPDQIVLFKKGDIDAVWTVEPWVSRLEMDAAGKIFLEQNSAITTVVATSSRVLEKHPDRVKIFVKAHEDLTDWINANPAEARDLIIKALENITKGKIPPMLVERALSRIKFTSEINRESLNEFIDDAILCGFIRRKPDMSNFVLEKE